MDHQLHPPAFVEEPLGDDAVCRRHNAQDFLTLNDVGDDLPSGFLGDLGFLHQPSLGLRRVLQSLIDSLPQIANLFR